MFVGLGDIRRDIFRLMYTVVDGIEQTFGSEYCHLGIVRKVCNTLGVEHIIADTCITEALPD